MAKAKSNAIKDGRGDGDVFMGEFFAFAMPTSYTCAIIPILI